MEFNQYQVVWFILGLIAGEILWRVVIRKLFSNG